MLELILTTAGVWMFIFRKVPSWSWFKFIHTHFPIALKNLWEGWTECAYCGAFWVALILRCSTGLQVLDLPLNSSSSLTCVLDAFAIAIGVLLLIRILDALATVTSKHHG